MSTIIPFPKPQHPESDEDLMVDRITDAVMKALIEEENRIDALILDAPSLGRWHRELFKEVPVIQKVVWSPDYSQRNAQVPDTICRVIPAVIRDPRVTKYQWMMKLDIYGWNKRKIQTEIEITAHHRRCGRTSALGWFASLCPLCGRTWSGDFRDDRIYLLAGETVFRCVDCVRMLRPDFKSFSRRNIKGYWSDEDIAADRERRSTRERLDPTCPIRVK